MIKEYTRQELALIRVKCDDSLLYFTRFFSKHALNQKFIVNWHHEELCKHFEDFSTYELDLLNINIPPRCSKTLIMIMSICRGVGNNDASNWLYITASDKLRKKTTVDIRSVLTHPLFKIMYGVELSKDQNSKDIIGFTGGGSLTTASVFGQIVGFGAGQMIEHEEQTEEERNQHTENNIKLINERVFEGGIFCDDLNKPDDSVKDNANNQNVIDVLFNTIFSRKNSSDTPISNIQQRVGLNDVTSALIDYYGNEDPRARFVVMPVIYPDGRLLWEWRYPLTDVTRLRSHEDTSEVFETQYMQNPQPSKGAMFRNDELSYFTMDELDPYLKDVSVGAIDVADEGNDNLSFPSGVVVGERVFITEWLYTKDNTEITEPQAIGLINGNDIDHTLIETNSFGKPYYARLKEATREECNIYGKFSTENKHARILKFAAFIKNRFVFRTDVLPTSDYAKAMKDLTRYMKDGSYKVDDAPDSLYLLAFLLKKLDLEQFK